MTGLDARIGYPTEHIVTPKIDEVKHPMYSTCIGLLMKGFEDYENKYEEYKRTNSSLQNNPPKTEESETIEPKTEKPKNKEKSKSSLSSFYQSILGFLNDDDVDDFNKKN
jgi:cell division protein FtsA